MSPAPEPSRAKRLKAATGTAHDRLDQRIMAARPFATRENYGRFLAVQHAFHGDLAPVYADPRLAGFISDLAARERLGAIGADLTDLGLPVPEAGPSRAPDPADLPEALGWLYVAEGSNLGAAFLLKMAAALGLGESFGARHLAGHPEGRAQHWRAFVAALDAVSLSEAEEARAVAGAEAAFGHVHGLVERHLG
jgi:heme oxygenase